MNAYPLPKVMMSFIKLGIAVVALVLLIAAAVVQRRRADDAPGVRRLFGAAGLFALADVVVAVVWR